MSDDIYRYDPQIGKKIEIDEHSAHGLFFIGYGWRQDERYLVFLNSYGKSFCVDGFRIVYFNCVQNLMTILLHG